MSLEDHGLCEHPDCENLIRIEKYGGTRRFCTWECRKISMQTPERRRRISETNKRLGKKPPSRLGKKFPNQKGTKCPEDCRCNRHIGKSCEDDCTCERHSEEATLRMSNAKQAHLLKLQEDTEYREQWREALRIGNTGVKHLGFVHKLSEEERERRRTLWKSYPGGRGRPGYHNNTWMRCLNSEGVFARELDEAGIQWVYEPKCFKLSWTRYTPDFYLPEFDIWVEIKGYMDEISRAKIDSFRSERSETLVVVMQTELPTQDYREVG